MQFEEDIYPSDAQELINQNCDNSDFVIIDVRSASEFQSGHIENAINIDINSSDFIEQIKTLDTDKTYLIYCFSGGRSSSALEKMKDYNFSKLHNMLQGISGWEASSLPVVK